MAKSDDILISVVVPVFNESAGLKTFHDALIGVLETSTPDYEIIYCDDGSIDDTAEQIKKWSAKNPRLKLVKLSRNFGKEMATTAGIHQAAGDAIITIDADGQHPVELIPRFLEEWQRGSKVVVGVRTANQKEGWFKHFGSKLFYRLFNRFTGIKLLPGSTDFRLIDSSVQEQFKRMTEHNRITRGLIDWLGFERSYITFRANPRLAGDPGYSLKKLFKLAVDSVISMSLSPLYITAYIGAVVLPLSVLLGLFMVVNTLLGDPAGLQVTGGAYAMVFLLFLVGILMVSQGIIGLYLSHIHSETQNRPLFIIDKENSVGLHEK